MFPLLSLLHPFVSSELCPALLCISSPRPTVPTGFVFFNLIKEKDPLCLVSDLELGARSL